MKAIISNIKKNSITLTIIVVYFSLIYMLYIFSAEKNSGMILLTLLTIAILSYSLYLTLTNTLSVNTITAFIKKISTGQYERLNISNPQYEEIEQNLNMISSRVKNLEQQKDTFIYDISHELRTPLSTMKLLAESIKYSNTTDIPMYIDFFSDIVSEIDRMNLIISDLMESVDLDPVNYIINLRLTYLNYLCENAIKHISPISKNKNITITYIEDSDIQIYLDSSKIERALINLLENSIKYSEMNSSITVRLFKSKNKACISVKDEGIGIPREEIDRIFERFYRIEKARSRSTGGSGLGLYITKRIVDMHRGEISIVSTENVGSEFTLKLPMNLYSNKL